MKNKKWIYLHAKMNFANLIYFLPNLRVIVAGLLEKKLDINSSKHWVKYNVQNFGTKESVTLNKNDICNYNEHKLKYATVVVDLKLKAIHKIALMEIKNIGMVKNSQIW